MERLGLEGARRGRGCRTTIPDTGTDRPDDLVQRQFVAERPNQLRVCGGWHGILGVTLTTETINGPYKTELIHPRAWRTVDEVEYAALGWVDWFNNRRLLEPVGDIRPVELEMAYYRQRGRVSRCGLTQTNESPQFPGRFKLTG